MALIRWHGTYKLNCVDQFNLWQYVEAFYPVPCIHYSKWHWLWKPDYVYLVPPGLSYFMASIRLLDKFHGSPYKTDCVYMLIYDCSRIVHYFTGKLSCHLTLTAPQYLMSLDRPYSSHVPVVLVRRPDRPRRIPVKRHQRLLLLLLLLHAGPPVPRPVLRSRRGAQARRRSLLGLSLQLGISSNHI